MTCVYRGFVFGSNFVIQYLFFIVRNHLAEEESSGCFTFIVFLVSFGFIVFASSLWSVDWSVVCDCDIFWSNSLAFGKSK